MSLFDDLLANFRTPIETSISAASANLLTSFDPSATPTNVPATDATTAGAAIRAAVLNGYTIVTFTSSGTWAVPSPVPKEVYYVVINGGGKGDTGTADKTIPNGSFPGGIGGSSGGYRAEQIDPATLTAGGSVTVTVGAGATTGGADGGTTSIGSITPTKNVGAIGTLTGYSSSSSCPGQGGNGGDVARTASTTYTANAGTAGTSSALGAGGTAGAGKTTSGTGNAGTAGGTASIVGAVKSGGGGGGGGGGVGNQFGPNTGGTGGAGGYPGGGSGGGGASASSNTQTVTGGPGGTAPNGIAFIMYR